MARENAVATASEAATGPAKLPGYLRFLLLILLSSSTSVALLSVGSEFLDPQLRAVTRSGTEDFHVLAPLAWKFTELAVCWFGSFDDIDILSLSVLTHAPWFFLLTTFYEVAPGSAILCLAVDAISVALPTRLLRPRAPAHNTNAPRAAVPNRGIINDVQTRAATSLLAAAVFAVALYTALTTGFLTQHLVAHFDGIPTLETAHAATLVNLLAVTLPLGYAAREFLLTPSLGALDNTADAKRKAFNPETAGLWEHVLYNFWWYEKGTRVLLRRTVTVVAVAMAHTVGHSVFALEGGDAMGAVGFAGVWAAATVVVAALFAWVEDVGESGESD
ncbi:hypothetical protein IWX49DRAFT_504456 [Phyllosticta citricarpa]|uniref:Uncharacterized protein n=2 Tax=Phyllosticta TaxID=121621 RepID=A0ABR1MEN9_9PEZI